jgi:hypothetical protein
MLPSDENVATKYQEYYAIDARVTRQVDEPGAENEHSIEPKDGCG